jgi:DNA-binding CsgD family transcriptional regulator
MLAYRTGRALFVTTRTVQVHLTHTYQKLAF